jgi:hypothetical protein
MQLKKLKIQSKDMRDKEDVQKELDKLAPNLAKLKKEGFVKPALPDGYFDRLPDTVLARAKAEREVSQDENPLKVVSDRKRKRPVIRSMNSSMRLALAACFLLLLGGAYWALLVMPTGNTDLVASIDQLNQEEIDQYIEANINDFDVSLMLEAELVDSDAMGNMFTNEIPEEDMDAYLDELLDGIDIEELQEAL